MSHDLAATRRMRRGYLAFAVTASALGLFAFLVFGDVELDLGAGGHSDASSSAPPFTVVIGRTAGGAAGWRSYAEALKGVSAAIGRPIRVRYAADQTDTVDVLRQGEASAGFVSNISFLIADAEGLVDPLVVPLIRGNESDAAVIVTAASSGLRSADELKGTRLAVVNRPSLAGDLYVAWWARRLGFTPATYFSAIVRVGSHEEALRTVLRNRADVAAVNKSQLGAFPEGTFRVLNESEAFPAPPFVVARSLDERTVDLVREALVRYQSTSREQVVRGFRPVARGEYRVLRQILSSAGTSFTTVPCSRDLKK